MATLACHRPDASDPRTELQPNPNPISTGTREFLAQVLSCVVATVLLNDLISQLNQGRRLLLVTLIVVSFCLIGRLRFNQVRIFVGAPVIVACLAVSLLFFNYCSDSHPLGEESAARRNDGTKGEDARRQLDSLNKHLLGRVPSDLMVRLIAAEVHDREFNGTGRFYLVEGSELPVTAQVIDEFIRAESEVTRITVILHADSPCKSSLPVLQLCAIAKLRHISVSIVE